MKNIHINLIMHTLVKEPVELVRALAGPDMFWHIYVHSRIPEVVTAADDLARDVSGVRVEQVGYNAGLARSWNEGIIASAADGADVIMIANDDTLANRPDMLRIAEAAMDCGHEYFMINGEGWHVQANVHDGLQLALAAVTPLWLEKLGMFDEGFLMIYHEGCRSIPTGGAGGIKALLHWRDGYSPSWGADRAAQ
jgi:hypothetical protein